MDPISRRAFLAQGGVVAATMAARPLFAAATTPVRPNVLFIWTDQQTAAAMSNAGNGWLNTPAMDSLAHGGMAFERAYCTNPICVPARTSWLTGCMPHETTVTYNTEDHPIATPPLAPLLARNGYDTGYVGKWHIPRSSEDTAWHGFDFVRETTARGPDPAIPAACAEFLRRRRSGPFFLTASFLNPHDICEWARMAAGIPDNLPNGILAAAPPPEQCPPLPANFAPPAHEPAVIRALQRAAPRTYPTRQWSDGTWRQYLWAYYRLVERVDAGVGQILDELRVLGLERDTLVVFSSDHGDGCAAHGWNQKTLFYEESVRIPLIVRPPGSSMTGRRDTANLVSFNLDFFPTVFDYAGVVIPRELKGRSLRSLIEERPDARGHEYVVSQSDLAPVYGRSGGVYGRMLRSGRYKYVRYSTGADPEQLFDLEADPGEMRDLKYDPAASEQLAWHRAQLDKWMTLHGDKFSPPATQNRAS